MDSLTQMALGAACGEKDDDLLFVNIYPRNLSLMKGIKEHLPMVKLKHFTRGYYALSTVDSYVTVTDLRMGSEPYYVFQFKVAKVDGSNSIPIKDKRLNVPRNWNHLDWVWQRIWQPMPKTINYQK